MAVKPCLEWVVDRLRSDWKVDQVIVMSIDSRKNLPVYLFCRDHLQVPFVKCGDYNSQGIPARVFNDIRTQCGADYVAAVSGQCPVIGSVDVRQIIGHLDADHCGWDMAVANVFGTQMHLLSPIFFYKLDTQAWISYNSIELLATHPELPDRSYVLGDSNRWLNVLLEKIWEHCVVDSFSFDDIVFFTKNINKGDMF